MCPPPSAVTVATTATVVVVAAPAAISVAVAVAAITVNAAGGACGISFELRIEPLAAAPTSKKEGLVAIFDRVWC